MKVLHTPLRVSHDHPAFDGHFPGQPLLPGVSLLSYVLEAALSEPAWAARLGTSPRLGAAKFLSAVLPGDALNVSLHEENTGLRFEVRAGERLAATGRWDLGA